ncbi:GerAB/ArcD/ProY family transporter [Bacillus sp. KH172YL63]|uniref:GerAB/ArcD/ProY family transporter n=1 Tax=Bacillus sp. KH172YL63 TaxID=2709784 RepID=UPI0013E44059|nr:GerAB/ArcD/ProY family transporter [Bacillus sp. KH172YL63]BCB04271.1 germination protein GerB [Bacillus sp. KH172YL63]
MNVNVNPHDRLMFNAFLIMFIIHTAQTGVGIAGLPRVIFLETNRDAWISVFLSGFLVAFVLFIMVKMLETYPSADLYGIHMDVYGKWLSKAFNLLYILYYLSITYVILMNYIEMVQAWIFPKMPNWLLMGLLLFLLVYAVLGGIRVVVGIAFLGLILAFWLLFMIYTPIKYMDFNHLQPVLTSSPKELMMGVYKTSFTIIGFEMLLFTYPYIKEKKQALKYALFGTAYTTFLYTVVTVVCIGFFSEDALTKTIWPVLSMFKILRIPNLERFEFIAVSYWMLVILPNICLFFWASTRGMKRVFKLSQKKAIFLFAGILWICSILVKDRMTMNMITDKIGTTSFILSFIYPCFLFLLVKIKRLVNRKGADI